MTVRSPKWSIPGGNNLNTLICLWNRSAQAKTKHTHKQKNLSVKSGNRILNSHHLIGASLFSWPPVWPFAAAPNNKAKETRNDPGCVGSPFAGGDRCLFTGLIMSAAVPSRSHCGPPVHLLSLVSPAPGTRHAVKGFKTSLRLLI